jgi:hypothetical protein
MDIKLLEKFAGLASRLSPENLHCDGEISKAEARRKEQGVRREWKALEDAQGPQFAISEDEIWRLWTASFASRSVERRVNIMKGFNNRHED